MCSPNSGRVERKQQQEEEEEQQELPPSSALVSASHLTRRELLKRRLEKLRTLSKFYRKMYWALMDRLKAQFRQYLWHYGLTPFQPHSSSFLEGSGENNSNNNHLPGDGDATPASNLLRIEGSSDSNRNQQRCAFVGCELKPMALTSFCHLHILSDSRQQLYKPCSYVIKSADTGPITCGKPILRSTVPSHCLVHSQKAQKHLARTFKMTGLNVSSTNKLAPPKFHVILAEYVRHIQQKRRAARLRGNKK